MSVVVLGHENTRSTLRAALLAVSDLAVGVNLVVVDGSELDGDVLVGGFLLRCVRSFLLLFLTTFHLEGEEISHIVDDLLGIDSHHTIAD